MVTCNGCNGPHVTPRVMGDGVARGFREVKGGMERHFALAT